MILRLRPPQLKLFARLRICPTEVFICPTRRMVCSFLDPRGRFGQQGGYPKVLKGWLPDGPQESCHEIACELGSSVGAALKASFGKLGWGEHAFACLSRRGCAAVRGLPSLW